MKAIVRYLYPHPEIAIKRPYLLIETPPKAGDYVIGHKDVVIQVNQSTCILFNNQVLHVANDALQLQEGEAVTLGFWCKKLENCNYPFCNGNCGGSSDNFYIIEHEKRPFE